MEQRIEKILAEMTLTEKTSLAAGADLWHTPAVPRLGIPRLKLSDGPAGVRGDGSSEQTAACFPCGSALGASWCPALVERVGAALAEEARDKGVHLLLAPTVNLHRSPLGGRHFECHAEDPYLAARLAVAYVRGVQSRRVGATVKHFVCNDFEFERHTISVEVDERTLREVYLPPFEAAVCEGDAWAVMSAYNRVNGVHASEHAPLLRELLKQEWGFRGLVVSDWFGTHSGAAAARAGLDLEMPGPPRFMGPQLLEAVSKGELEEAVVDDMVRRLLRLMVRTGALDEPAEREERSVERPGHRALAREAAAASMVLLQNRGNVLPFDASQLRSLAVIGPNALRARIQGGGSANVRPHRAVAPLEGIQRRCGDAVRVQAEPGCTNHKSLPDLDTQLLRPTPDAAQPGFALEAWDNLELAGEPKLRRVTHRSRFLWLGSFGPMLDTTRFSLRLSGHFSPPRSGTYRLGLTSAGRSRLRVDGQLEIDNWTRQTRGESFYRAGSTEVDAALELRAGETRRIEIEYSREGAPRLGGLRIGCLLPLPDDALERAVAAAASADAALVVVGLDEEWESEGADRTSLALPGRQDELVEQVTRANPRTVVVVNSGAPVRMDWAQQVPAILWMGFPGQEGGHALADVLFGDADPGGRLPTTWPRRLEDHPSARHAPAEGRCRYGEGVFVGHRHFDREGLEPHFPFGHGLSYARFAYGALRLSAERSRLEQPLEIRLDVTNESARPGQEVVQLYLRDLEASVPRPEQELRGFAKLSLAPGETQTARFVLDRRAFSFWDPDARGWRAEPGGFELRVGASSCDVRQRARFELEA